MGDLSLGVAGLETIWLRRYGLRVTVGRDYKTRLNFHKGKKSLWMSIAPDSKCFHKIQLQLSETVTLKFAWKGNLKLLEIVKLKRSCWTRQVQNTDIIKGVFVWLVFSICGGERGKVCGSKLGEGKKVTQAHFWVGYGHNRYIFVIFKYLD